MSQNCLRGPSVLLVKLVFAFLSACTTNRNNADQIRERTAQATETVRQDARAIAEGVKEGMASDHKAIDINRASRGELLTLPGLSDHEADRIIASRPFENAHDLVTRRIVSKSEYDAIQDRVIAGR
jgi:DNA uptake protein ComE-like DNA-binding protein